MKSSHLEENFLTMWELSCSIPLIREVYLIPNRRFRVDFFHLSTLTVIEINGSVYRYAGHSTGKGINRDYEKYNLLTLYGYNVFILSSQMITEEWLKLIQNFIKSHS